MTNTANDYGNIRKKEKDKFAEDIVSDVLEDFENRRKERADTERQWELNMNFLAGNQYCGIGARGEIESEDREYYWQGREVYNHIAPVIESRLARFSRISPVMSVRPRSDDDADVNGASLAEKLLDSAFERYDLDGTVKKTTVWSETCGTGFYKIVWDNRGGNAVGVSDGKTVYEGDVKVIPVSPFEIFPDSVYNEEIGDCFSIIHARAVPVREIREKYGVAVEGTDVDVYNLSVGAKKGGAGTETSVKNAAVVIEKYERPSEQFPAGRLITVSGGKLLYYGELPYINGKNGTRTFPFVKQDCLKRAGFFFGSSITERLIPVQRAFNAVKNRKHEFLNRLSMGIMKVEDGSVDVDDLESEGLPPGKVLVYRQGANAPEMMSGLSMPSDFNEEEEKLLGEFVTISGVAEVSSSMSNARVTSGTALEILVEQDNERLIVSAETIRRCYLEIARQTIRLYAQFSAGIRTVKVRDSFNKTRILYADGAAMNSDDVFLENENELLYSHGQKKEMIFKLYESGLLTDDTGKLRPATKEKVLSLLGYKDLDYQKGVSEMQSEKAQRENEKIRKTGLKTEEVDDHRIHIDEHTRYILSEYDELTREEKERLYAHLKEHKEKTKEERAAVTAAAE